jgi:hypothetical protein
MEPAKAGEGSDARTSTVGLPRLSKIWRALTDWIVAAIAEASRRTLDLSRGGAVEDGDVRFGVLDRCDEEWAKGAARIYWTEGGGAPALFKTCPWNGRMCVAVSGAAKNAPPE